VALAAATMTTSMMRAVSNQDEPVVLLEPDFRLMQALVTSQQTFVLSDPSLPDNPIVYCSDGFCKMSGYKRADVLGRNCRFMQGPATDQRDVAKIREAVAEGRDITVCLLNYRKGGTPFWNQFFVAAIRNSKGQIVNFVSVQCEVNGPSISQIKSRVKRIPVA
jgi:PAS domain S-box-containing protein